MGPDKSIPRGPICISTDPISQDPQPPIFTRLLDKYPTLKSNWRILGWQRVRWVTAY